MKILIVSGGFFPQQNPRSFRTTELTAELAKQGHQVTVYIPENNYDYNNFKIENKIDIRFVHIDREKKIELKGNRVSIIVKRIINRFLNTFLAYPDIQYLWKLPRLFSKIGGYDLVISIAVPHPIHWGVEKALRKNKKLTHTWIADCGDPFMLCKTDTFRNPFFFKLFEKSFCKRANYITIPVEGGITGYYREFWDKIRIIPQGFDFSKIRKVEKYIPNEVITFIYAGSFIPGRRDIRPILNFLLDRKIIFKFYIYTNQSVFIEPYKQIFGEKLLISSYIDRDELIYRMSICDFVLNIENGTSVQIPSKLIDYALSGRPILSIDSQNIDEGKFTQFLNGDYSQQYIVSNIDDYNIKNVAKKFIDLATS